MYVCIFSTTFVWHISYSKKNWARCDQTWMLIFMQSNCYSWPILIKFEFSPQVVEKCQNIKFHVYPSCGSPGVPWGEKDRAGDVMKLVVVFRNFANAPSNALKGSSSRKCIKCGGLRLYLTIFFGRDKEISAYPEKRPHQPFICWKLALFPGRTGAGVWN
jgi:hypothetical protein